MKSPIALRKNSVPHDVIIEVVTGDKLGAGTDSKLFVVLHDVDGRTSQELRLNNRLTTNCRGQSCRFQVCSGVEQGLGLVHMIQFRLQKFGLGHDWFVDRFAVTVVSSGASSVFPVHRWIKANGNAYFIGRYDINLPHLPHLENLPEHQLRAQQSQRMGELGRKRENYKYKCHIPGGPAQVETLPADERFSESYYWDFTKRKSKLLTTTIFTEWTQTSWNSLDDLKSVYSKSLGEPYPMRRWKEDRWFGLQRVQGVNPVIIQLCTSLPENLDVTDATLEGLLDDLTLEEALEKKKMFICNLDILDGLDCKDDKELAAPIALFYLDKDDKLNPVAIQLRQQKGEDNPVYTPNDSPNTWLVAKMFYNNAEAQHHQALTHLGFTHLLMEGVVVCTHRNLSPSHPLFKLLAPHFLFLLAINERGLRKLVSPGGWVDRSMTQGVKGIFNLIKRGLEQWRFDIHGKPETFLRHNGTLDPEVLPYYPYRDDALLLHNEIEKYVTQVVQHHYDTPEKLAEDWELQWWREELVKQRQLGGVGLEGVPGDPVKGFCKVEEVIETVTVIISTCSLGHSAANFQQYEQYAFVPNYPGILMEDPPKTKREYDEKDIMKLLPNKRTTLDIMVITNLLSSKGTKSLGDFEMQYLYDPVGVRAAEEFRKNLKKASCIVNIRNLDRELEFDWLNPAIVPNSISV
ncbi:polyunsaturated fatty acid 5-lipoxygenase-like isoform X3 [Oratosquilla oratoria]|uniref:polyunsaturated fatty acid 5-lipoxygenase-like isoform X3 n=1 Tax=Oratosquilla oratoria TaxID=337810 RepID=UPI003F76042D